MTRGQVQRRNADMVSLLSADFVHRKEINGVVQSHHRLVGDASASGVVASSSTTIKLNVQPPRYMTADTFYLVIDPHTTECEIRKVKSMSADRLTMTLYTATTYNHMSGDDVFLITNPIINVNWFGMTKTARILSGLSITATDNTLTASGDSFFESDVGRTILVYTAGASSETLVTTVASYTSATEVELTDAAGTTASAVGGVIGDDAQVIVTRALAQLPGQSIRLEFNSDHYYLFTSPVAVTRGGVIFSGNFCTIYKDTHGEHYNTSAAAGSMFRIYGSVTGTDPEAYDVKDVIVENFKFQNVGQEYGPGTDDGYYTTLNGSAVTYNRRYNKQVNTDPAVNIQYAHNVEIRNCFALLMGKLCSTDSYGGAVHVIDNHIYGWGNVAVSTGRGSVVEGNWFEQTSPEQNESDNTADHGTSHAIYNTSGHGECSIVNNVFKYCWNVAIKFDTTSSVFYRCVVSHNKFFRCNNTGYFGSYSAEHMLLWSDNVHEYCGPITVTQQSATVVIQDNVFNYNNKDLISDSSGWAIAPSGAKYLLIKGNQFLNMTGTNVSGIRTGLYTNLLLTEITGNTFIDNTLSIYLTVGQAANTLIIKENFFDDNMRIDAAVGSYSDNLYITKNTFVECGLGTYNASGLKIIDNTFIVPSGGYSIQPGASFAGSVTPTYIIGNRFVNTSGAAAYAINFTNYPAAGVVVGGNIYSGAGLVPWVGYSNQIVQTPSADMMDAIKVRMIQITSAPSAIVDGDIIYADGTSYNPGSGQGTYERVGGAWGKL